jgi:hypothetical protein
MPTTMTERPASAQARPFSRRPLTREHLREIVRAALQPLEFAHAAWEGGSVAFGRQDAWSDVDLQVVVEDDRVDDTFNATEKALGTACPIESTYTVPAPTSHGHAQRFYRFQGQPAWMMLDLCVMKRSAANRFLEPEIHGEASFLFDKIGLRESAAPVPPEVWDAKLRARVAELRARTSMLAVLADKEARRRHPIDACAFHTSLILAPLVELLRIRHDPWRHDFGLRGLHHALPAALARRVEELCFVRNLADLQVKQRAALRWIEELVIELEKAPKLTYSSRPAPAQRSRA